MTSSLVARLLLIGVAPSLLAPNSPELTIYVERLWRTLKQEAIYYYKPSSIRELEIVIKDFVIWYNYQRRHQSLQYKIPAEVYYKM